MATHGLLYVLTTLNPYDAAVSVRSILPLVSVPTLAANSPMSLPCADPCSRVFPRVSQQWDGRTCRYPTATFAPSKPLRTPPTPHSYDGSTTHVLGINMKGISLDTE